MSETVFCQKYKKDMPALSAAPVPGVMGERLCASISAQAWDDWIAHQTLLINEHQLNLLDEQAQHYLLEEMEAFLFQDKSEKPDGYTEKS